ncbi:MAG: 3-hydroxybutyryl-CoA dehydrogenase [Deltaproteobacteria bacterium]|nr:3-hydroxybutyryl-CoA dehydrogenase [Deltaproteobacteria bacterium]
MEIRKIMVVGSGLMGSGIAQAAIQAGYDVLLNDTTEALVKRGETTLSNNLDRQVKKGKMSEADKAAVMARVHLSTALDDAAGADFVVEAAFENFAVKQGIFQKLDAVCRPEAIFATNTSSLSITKLAAGLSRPDRFIGMHFFSPVPVMALVEIIRGLKTSEETMDATEAVVAKMGKESVRVKDVPGFLVNRINTALRAEAYNCLAEGVASIEDIDKALKLALRHPMGPFEVADFVGLDVGFAVLRSLYEGYGDVKWRPSMLLEQLVASGDLGQKTGKGWYDYTSGEKKPRKDVKF